MLKLMTDRAWRKPDYTIGRFFANGERVCESLEDTDRGLSQEMPTGRINSIKVYGHTAIPRGIYKVVLSVSKKFKGKPWAKRYNGLVPEILNVKGYSGVRIHPGNRAADTLGCILPGYNKKVGELVDSTKAYYLLMDNYILPAWKAGEEITIEIL